MINHITQLLILLVQGFLLIAIAPLFIGWINQLKCWMQQRSAASIIQPYYSSYKLLMKELVMAENASWLFRFAPYIYFISLAMICFSLPFFMSNTLVASSADVIVVVGLLALGRIFLALAAMDIGTAFGSLGARREMFVACLTEPVLLIVFYNVTLLTHSASIGGSSIFFLYNAGAYPSLLFSLIALILISLAETGRVPIDNPATHLELTMIHEAMVLEYSGRYLALIEWANAIKFTVYLTFMVTLFIPVGLSNDFQMKYIAIGLIATLTKFFLLTILIAFIESINSKLRIFKVPDYLAGAFMLAVLGVLVTQLLGASS